MEMLGIRHAIAICALLGAGYAFPAAAETTLCTNITSVPTTITTQGVYCMKQHITTNLASGAAITVNVNNVTIDCNEFKLGNLAAGVGTNAIGVLADGRNNVTVRNCGIRGFRTGVSLVDGLYQVYDNRFDQNTQTSIQVSGDGSVVRNNTVVDTGGSTVAGITDFHGILTEGDVDVVGNLVSNVVATAGGNRTVYGIRGANMDAAFVRDNRVNNLAPSGLLGNRRAIFIESGANNSVTGNTIVMGAGLLATDTAIRCGSSLAGLLGGVATQNVILQAGLLGTVGALLNCTSVLGGNYVQPL